MKTEHILKVGLQTGFAAKVWALSGRFSSRNLETLKIPFAFQINGLQIEYLDDSGMSSLVFWLRESLNFTWTQIHYDKTVQLLKTVHVLYKNEIYVPLESFFKGFLNAKAKRKFKVQSIRE